MKEVRDIIICVIHYIVIKKEYHLTIVDLRSTQKNKDEKVKSFNSFYFQENQEVI